MGKNPLQSAQNLVFEELRRRIQSGKLPPGTKIVIDDVAADLGVSRTPVREALQRLESEGFVTIEPRRCTMVSQVSVEDLTALYEARMSIEGFVCDHVIKNIKPESVARLEKLRQDAQRYLEANEFERLRQTNRKFHEILYKAIGNPFLEEILIRLRDRSWRYIGPALRAKQQLHWSHKTHTEIIESIKLGDPDRFRKAITDDLRLTAELAKRIYDSGASSTKGG